MYWYGHPAALVDAVMVRYCHHRQEIQRLFGPTHNMHILEIGGGFGGQARTFAGQCFDYAIHDLLETRRLQGVYLSLCGCESEDAEPGLKYDLVISTYAFSELNADVQRGYVRDYVDGTPRGWMLYNFINPKSMDPDDVIAVMPAGARWEPEIPLTSERNRVLVWGDHGT